MLPPHRAARGKGRSDTDEGIVYCYVGFLVLGWYAARAPRPSPWQLRCAAAGTHGHPPPPSRSNICFSETMQAT